MSFLEYCSCAAVAGPAQVPLRLQIRYQGQLLRELQANISTQVSSEGGWYLLWLPGADCHSRWAMSLADGLRRGATQPDNTGDGLASIGGAADEPGEGSWAWTAHQWAYCCPAGM